jgi:O-antigen/teichoic acid export membrane protein
VIRFGSNLIITRLLLPEHFGLMALVTTFLVGLALFSDTGVGPNIIQNPKGEEPIFFNTAWTVQAIRGVLLWVVAVACWPGRCRGSTISPNCSRCCLWPD